MKIEKLEKQAQLNVYEEIARKALEVKP